MVKQRGRKEVNIELKKGAEFFGDIVIVPFLDSYDLVVLKTVAICEYGVCIDYILDLLLHILDDYNSNVFFGVLSPLPFCYKFKLSLLVI